MDDIQNALNAVGALAELVALFRNQLIQNGFSDDDALYLCGIFLETHS